MPFARMQFLPRMKPALKRVLSGYGDRSGDYGKEITLSRRKLLPRSGPAIDRHLRVR